VRQAGSGLGVAVLGGLPGAGAVLVGAGLVSAMVIFRATARS
jgi:hypothetical protein